MKPFLLAPVMALCAITSSNATSCFDTYAMVCDAKKCVSLSGEDLAPVFGVSIVEDFNFVVHCSKSFCFDTKVTIVSTARYMRISSKENEKAGILMTIEKINKSWTYVRTSMFPDDDGSYYTRTSGGICPKY